MSIIKQTVLVFVIFLACDKYIFAKYILVNLTSFYRLILLSDNSLVINRQYIVLLNL